MTPFSSVKIKVKPHVKYFLEHRFGKPCRFPAGHLLGIHFNMLLSRPVKMDNHFVVDYPDTVTIMISQTTFRRYGFGLSKTNRKNFNLVIEDYIRDQIHTIAEQILVSASINENWKKRYEDLQREHKALVEANKSGIEPKNVTAYRKFNIAINKRIEEHTQNRLREKHALQTAAYDCLGFTEDILSYDAIRKSFYRYRISQKP